jgi:hypothetical protein
MCKRKLLHFLAPKDLASFLKAGGGEGFAQFKTLTIADPEAFDLVWK